MVSEASEKSRTLWDQMAAGCSDISIEEMPVNWSYVSFDESWAFTTQVAGPLAALVNELPSDEVDRLRAALEENERPYRTDSGLTLPGVTINVAAS